MKHYAFHLITFVICLSNIEVAVAQDTTSHIVPDTAAFKWPSFIGGDLFLSEEIYCLHLNGPGSLTGGTGLGAEVRIRPLFLGGLIGLSGDEGILPFQPDSPFFYSSLYAGVIICDYRVEIGEIGSNIWEWGTRGGGESYATGFLGISKRWSDIFFFEPGIKIMFPIVAHYDLNTGFDQYVAVTQHYHARDLFFAISVKVGIGFN